MAQRLDREPHLFATDRYEDITEEFRREAARLPQGQLAMRDGFALFDAMSAAEIGNPRMDSGINYVPLEEDLSHMHPIRSTKDLEDVLDILNSLVMAWLQGYQLVQTVLCCKPVEDVITTVTRLRDDSIESVEPELLAQYLSSAADVQSLEDVLTVYVLGVIKSVHIVYALMEQSSGVIFPEEDFHFNLFGYYYLEHTETSAILAMLDRATVFCKDADEGLKLRLELLNQWLRILECPITASTQCHDLALKALGVYDSYDRADRAKDFVGNGVQSRCSSFVLPSAPVIIPIKSAAEQWKGILQAVKNFKSILEISRSADFLGYFLQFSSQRNLPIVRAIIKTLFQEDSILGIPATEWVVRDINELSFPDWSPSSNPALYRSFLNSASICYTDLLFAFCMNRCRLREALITCVTTWDALQVAAEDIDEKSSQAKISRELLTQDRKSVPALEFSAWVYARKLQIMLWTILISFELDIPSTWEYSYMYWYAVQLIGELQGHLSRLKSYFEQHGLRLKDQSYGYIVSLELEARVLSQLCSANYFTHLAMHKLNMVEAPNLHQTTLELLFRLRFVAFASVGAPEMCSLQQYNRISDKIELEVLFAAAKNSLDGARSLMVTLTRLTGENPEMNLIKRSAIALKLCVSALENRQKSQNQVKKFTLERNRYHWYFPVPVFQESSTGNEHE